MAARLDQSRSQRILWLMEELNIPYELQIFHRNQQTRLAPPELKKVHALGKSPVISVTAPGSTEPIVIAESGFIVEYLCDHFSNGKILTPKRYKEGQEGKVGGETETWMRYRYYMHYAEGSLMSLLLISIIAASRSRPSPSYNQADFYKISRTLPFHSSSSQSHLRLLARSRAVTWNLTSHPTSASWRLKLLRPLRMANICADQTLPLPIS